MASEQEINDEINEIVEKVLVSYGESIVTSIREKIASADKLASGELYNSIDYKIETTNNNVSLGIEGTDYLKWVDGGRRPGKKQPPIDQILKWIQERHIKANEPARRNSLGRFSKGFKLTQKRNSLGQFSAGKLLDRQTKLAWAIAKSISQKGIPAMNLLPQNLGMSLSEEIANAISEGFDGIISKELAESFLTVSTNYITTEIN